MAQECVLFFPQLVLFRVFLLSLLLPEPVPVPLLLPCGPHRQYPTGTPPNEESGPLAGKAPLTGYEPNILDDFHYSGTTEIFLQEQSSDAVPSYLHDAELDDETIGKSAIFTTAHSGARGTSGPETSLSLS